MGIPLNPDFNGARQNGVGVMQHTMGVRNGRMERCDAVTAFIADLMNDKRLTIITGAQVDRVLFEGGRAVGLSYREGGQAKTVQAAREVLLAAGTYNTAKLMMLSGLGPADHLREHGVDVVADLAGVGSNLQDHHEVPVIATTKGRAAISGRTRAGRWCATACNTCSSLRAGDDDGHRILPLLRPRRRRAATIQLYCAPIVYLDRDVSSEKPSHGVTLTSCLLRPKARGTVRLRSADPDAMPLVDSNFFGHPDDLRLTVASLRFARQVLASRPLSDRIKDELLPGRAVTDDAGLEAFCGKTVKTNYHPVGSAPMGPDGDPMAVLDAQLRVRGVEGLRVIDCSAMPMIPSGNTNAPVMALASRAVDLIAGVVKARGAAA